MEALQIWGYIFGGAGIFALIVGLFSVWNGRVTRGEISNLIKVESQATREILAQMEGRQTGTEEILARMDSRQTRMEEILVGMEGRQTRMEELLIRVGDTLEASRAILERISARSIS